MCFHRAPPLGFCAAPFPGSSQGVTADLAVLGLMFIDTPTAGTQQAVLQDHDIHIFSVSPQATIVYEDFQAICMNTLYLPSVPLKYLLSSGH